MDILICGFPHTGTSILKSIIGHCPDVYEFPYEHYDFSRCKTNKIHRLIKYPAVYDFFFDEFKDVMKIFLIRNPYDLILNFIIRIMDYINLKSLKELQKNGFFIKRILTQW